MDKSTLLRFQGYVKTPPLFKNNVFQEIKQLEFRNFPEEITEQVTFKNHRLGKLVEEFVFYQLQHQDNIEWIAENIQIQKDKQTIGEMDAVFYQDQQAIHLEIVYKFYLYDTLETYNEPLAYWVGPNRRDSLLYKLDKLKNKQFPLLYREETKQQLKSFNISITEVSQQVCFKAQLFLPYNHPKMDLERINQHCVSGFFISYKDISIFENYEFFIPKKLDWLIIPHYDVEWSAFEDVKYHIEEQIQYKRSPLVWIKQNAMTIEKCFITFW